MKQCRNKVRPKNCKTSGRNGFFSVTATGLSFILLLMPTTATALGLNCTVSATGVAFGNYNATNSSPTDAAGNVRVRCTVLLVSVGAQTNISLDTGGSGSFAPRKMSSGANLLSYNLYKENTHTTVWGDGTGGTGIWTDNALIAVLGTNIDHTIYGSIPAGQYVAAGSYADTITVTVEYHEGI
ncbi:spore coat U domain-containing protein [Methylobacter svalbardensis]|uniref:Csu type fimbrial protein n=1 Tax=Methylobacter svalbardensis TaxID=3080016 RepID=UPI0030EB8F84